MKVLVTGASGFLGSHVAELLCRDGHQVRCLVRRTSNLRFLETLDVELIHGSVEDRSSLEEATHGVEGVVHAAGLVKARGADEFYAVNVRGTENLLGAVEQQADGGFRRFVLVSSLAAVGPSSDGKPVDPAQTSPVTHYGRSKKQAEEMVREASARVPTVILRPPMIYGPRDNESFAFFKTISRGMLPKLGDGSNTMSVIYATDAARACIRALEAEVESGSAYFIDDGRVYVWRDMLDDLEHALGKKAKVRFGVPFPMLRLAATASETMGKLTGKAVMLTRDKVNELSAPHWVCDSSDTRSALGWQPEVDWAEGTRRAAAWYKLEGWL
jgi:nucleoside-diphosphate-sugar epimerase